MDYNGQRAQGLAAAIFYGVLSASMAFVNKAVISSYSFNFPFFILSCQMTVTVAFLELMGKLGKIKLLPYNLKNAKTFLLPSIGYAVHSSLSLIALEGLNIPMYTALKRCTPLVNLILAVVLLGKPNAPFGVNFSIVLITVGCFVAVLGDLSFDAYSYTVGGLSVLAQGIYLTLVQKSSENNLSTLDILHLNSYNTLLPFIVMCLLTNEPHNIKLNPYLFDGFFHATFVILILMGSVLNYSLFLCTTLNSALTTSLVGVAKSTIQTIIGFFVFGGVKYNPLNIIGIIMNAAGGILYAWAKFHQEIKKKLLKNSSSLNLLNGCKPKALSDSIEEGEEKEGNPI